MAGPWKRKADDEEAVIRTPLPLPLGPRNPGCLPVSFLILVQRLLEVSVIECYNKCLCRRFLAATGLRGATSTLTLSVAKVPLRRPSKSGGIMQLGWIFAYLRATWLGAKACRDVTVRISVPMWASFATSLQF